MEIQTDLILEDLELQIIRRQSVYRKQSTLQEVDPSKQRILNLENMVDKETECYLLQQDDLTTLLRSASEKTLLRLKQSMSINVQVDRSEKETDREYADQLLKKKNVKVDESMVNLRIRQL